MKNWSKIIIVIACIVWFNGVNAQILGGINLIFPENEHEFTLREDKIFRWYTPDNWVEGQEYYYYMKIVKMNKNDNPEDAIHNEAYFQDTTEVITYQGYRYVFLNDLYFASGQYFAWQVKAYSADTVFAESDVNWFKGPPPFEYFKSGNRTVYATEFTNIDEAWDSICGYGHTKVLNQSPARTIPIYFENIKVKRSGAYLFQTAGTIYGSYKDTFNIRLDDESTTTAFPMYLDSLIITKDETKSKCSFSPELIIGSDTISLDFNEWISLNSYDVPKDTFNINNSEILYNGFIIDINELSYIYTSGLKYKPKYYGKVKYTYLDDTLVFEIPANADDITYFSAAFEDTVTITDHIKIFSTSCTVDFSSNKSPGAFTDSLTWEGIYFNNLGIDKIKQDSTFVFDLTKEPSATFKADSSSWLGYITSGKPIIDVDTIQENPSYTGYNYFKAYYDTIKINNINDSIVWDIKGKLIVPYLTGNPYSFSIPYQNSAIQLAETYDSIFEIFPLYELELRNFAFILIEEEIDTIYGVINHEDREIDITFTDGTQGTDNSFKVYPLFDISGYKLLIDEADMVSGNPDSYIMFYGLISESVELELQSYNDRAIIYDLNVQKTESVGYNKLDMNTKIKVSPNPVVDYIEISGLKPGSLISIFDINGKQILTHEADEDLEKINTHELKCGTYFIHVSNNYEYHTKKIIKL